MFQVWYISEGFWDYRTFPTFEKALKEVERANKSASIYQEGYTNPQARWIPNCGIVADYRNGGIVADYRNGPYNLPLDAHYA